MNNAVLIGGSTLLKISVVVSGFKGEEPRIIDPNAAIAF